MTPEGPTNDGVIKYSCHFTQEKPLPNLNGLEDLHALRQLLYSHGLVGQDPKRYGGFGYGNISQRVDSGGSTPEVVTTATQTGGIAVLEPQHYTRVTGYNLEANEVTASGANKPSSEVMTHLAVYESDKTIRAVAHAHSPEIWKAAKALGIPETSKDVSYGTPEMAKEVMRLFLQTKVREKGIFSMAGHEDGMITFGHTPQEAGKIMLSYLEAAKKLPVALA